MSKCVQVLTAEELKTADPRRFDREYSKWTEWQWQDAWFVEDAQGYFTEKYKPMGIEVSSLNYSIGYCQSDFASFDGRVYLAEWMEKMQICPDGPTYAERYPALYLACKTDGGYITVNGEDSRRGYRCDWYDVWISTAPCGIFANMPEEDWDSLLESQAAEADLEGAILERCRTIGREIYEYLRDSYEAATSEEAFIESCEANEITFEIEED